jgi:AcrR family transcriptional regulator
MRIPANPRVRDIEAAAERLFRRQGYHATSVRQLAGEVNLQGGSLYAHFASKEHMLAAIVERAADQFHAALEPVVRAPGTTRERLRAAFAAHIGVIAANPDAAAVYFDAWRHLGEPRRSAIRRRRNAYEELWRQLLAAGVAAGELRAIDPRLGAIACLSLCNWLYQWYDPEGPLPADEIAAQLAAFLLDGLARPEPMEARP